MVGWTGIIGKTINFVVEKIVGKKLDFVLDDRRKAARQFYQLYLAVSDLEVLCKELITELRAMTGVVDPSVPAEWLSDISITIDETSERFLEATQGLNEVLCIFDPLLAQTVSGLEADKFSFSSSQRMVSSLNLRTVKSEVSNIPVPVHTKTNSI